MAVNNVIEFEFRGVNFKLNQRAAHSVKVQKFLTLGDVAGMQQKFYWAVDQIFCGKFDEYLEIIPAEDGSISELGASDEDFAAFMAAALEALNAKN